MTARPIAVLVSDVHYSLKNLELSDAAYRAAISKASELGVPLIDGGDLTDDKAIIRAEVANRLIETFEWAEHTKGVRIHAIVGNHSLVSTRGTEHALNFLRPYCEVVDFVGALKLDGTIVTLIPYKIDSEDFIKAVRACPEGQIIVGHQGTIGGVMGHYVQDPSAFDPQLTKRWRIYLGHYHRHYELENTVSIGNPFTMSYGEADDGPKGFLILYSDGSYKREILNLRRHVIQELDWTKDPDAMPIRTNFMDLGWLKIRGTKKQLADVNKEYLGKFFVGHANYKLDLIPVSEEIVQPKAVALTGGELLDSYIDQVSESKEDAERIKGVWRGLA